MASLGKPCNRDGCDGLLNEDNGCTNPSCVTNMFNRKRRAEELHAERDVRARQHPGKGNHELSTSPTHGTNLGECPPAVHSNCHHQENPYNFAKALSGYKPHGSSASPSDLLGTFIERDDSQAPPVAQHSRAADEEVQAVVQSARICIDRLQSFARIAASWAAVAEEDASLLRANLSVLS